MSCYGLGYVMVCFQRSSVAERRHLWTITTTICDSVIQANAVTDDFGDLVAVTDWK